MIEPIHHTGVSPNPGSYADYALAYQLIEDSFRESLGEDQRYTDDRVRLIEIS